MGQHRALGTPGGTGGIEDRRGVRGRRVIPVLVAVIAAQQGAIANLAEGLDDEFVTVAGVFVRAVG